MLFYIYKCANFKIQCSVLLYLILVFSCLRRPHIDIFVIFIESAGHHMQKTHTITNIEIDSNNRCVCLWICFSIDSIWGALHVWKDLGSVFESVNSFVELLSNKNIEFLAKQNVDLCDEIIERLWVYLAQFFWFMKVSDLSFTFVTKYCLTWINTFLLSLMLEFIQLDQTKVIADETDD